MSIILLNNEVVHYEALGRGKPVLFLHTWLGSWRYWIPTMQAASISYRTYALDLFGFGDSAKKNSFYSYEEQINLIHGFLEEIGVSKIALVGHGLGAVIAILYTLCYQESIDRLIAVNLPNNTSEIKARLLTSSTIEFIQWLSGLYAHESLNTTEVSKTDPTAIHISFSNLVKLNLSNYTQTIVHPCLFIHGQGDSPLEDNSNNRSFQRLSENSQHLIFEQSGHYPMLDEANKFQRLVIDFLGIQSMASIQQLQIKEEWKRRVR